MKNKILLIGFGGTISMVPNEQGALAPALSTDQLVDRAPGLKSANAVLTVKQLLNKDSTELTPEDWKLLIDEIVVAQKQYDGILVAHGTDTMAYSATATAISIGKNLRVPVVFTGSQLPIIEPGTDAQSNLERSMNAVLQAIEAKIIEVMIVFDDRVLRGARTIKVDESRFDAFDSPAFPRLADITAVGAFFSPSSIRSSDIGKVDAAVSTSFDKGIIGIDTRPGLLPGIIKDIIRSPKCTGLVLKSLGAGNVPVEGKYSLLPAIKEAIALNKPVILATKFVGGKVVPGLYESGRAALEAGAGHSGDMTDVATEVKLMWLMGKGITKPSEVNKAMLESVIGEISEQK